MPGKYSKEDQKKMFILFCFFISFICLMVITMVTNANKYYTQPYEAVVKREAADEEPPSNQPKAPGFKESDIKKYKGDRYSAF